MALIEGCSPRPLFGREAPPASRSALRARALRSASIALLSGLLVAALAPRPSPALRAQVAAPAEPTVVELTDLETLRARFDQDLGKLRLVLLLSPT